VVDRTGNECQQASIDESSSYATDPDIVRDQCVARCENPNQASKDLTR